MYADIDTRIEKINRQIERVSVRMIEAEGDKYLELETKLERLQDKLAEYTMLADDMELIKPDYE